MIEPILLKRIIEAALLASAHPLSLPQISGLCRGNQVNVRCS
jgi:chromosome segregation and condensation protein ScpB